MKNLKIYISLENIRSLYNIGAIIRSTEFFGFNHILLIGYSGIDNNEPDMIHRKIKKTALGSNTKINTEIFADINEVKEAYPGMDIISIENNVPDAKNIYIWKPERNCILLFGNEVDGITKEGLENSKEILEIPRVGTHSSLNVATACGIVLSVLRNKL